MPTPMQPPPPASWVLATHQVRELHPGDGGPHTGGGGTQSLWRGGYRCVDWSTRLGSSRHGQGGGDLSQEQIGKSVARPRFAIAKRGKATTAGSAPTAPSVARPTLTQKQNGADGSSQTTNKINSGTFSSGKADSRSKGPFTTFPKPFRYFPVRSLFRGLKRQFTTPLTRLSGFDTLPLAPHLSMRWRGLRNPRRPDQPPPPAVPAADPQGRDIAIHNSNAERSPHHMGPGDPLKPKTRHANGILYLQRKSFLLDLCSFYGVTEERSQRWASWGFPCQLEGPGPRKRRCRCCGCTTAPAHGPRLFRDPGARIPQSPHTSFISRILFASSKVPGFQGRASGFARFRIKRCPLTIA